MIGVFEGVISKEEIWMGRKLKTVIITRPGAPVPTVAFPSDLPPPPPPGPEPFASVELDPTDPSPDVEPDWPPPPPPKFGEPPTAPPFPPEAVKSPKLEEALPPAPGGPELIPLPSVVPALPLSARAKLDDADPPAGRKETPCVVLYTTS